MSSDRKEKEMICALTAEEHSALQRDLNALPDTMPPRTVWHRIRQQAEAEGLIRTPRMQRRSTWYAAAGVAAAAVLAVVMLPGRRRSRGLRRSWSSRGSSRTTCVHCRTSRV